MKRMYHLIGTVLLFSTTAKAERHYYCHTPDVYQSYGFEATGHLHPQSPSYGWISAYDDEISDKRSPMSMYPWGFRFKIKSGQEATVIPVKIADDVIGNMFPTPGPELRVNLEGEGMCVATADDGTQLKVDYTRSVTRCYDDVNVLSGAQKNYLVVLHPSFVKGSATYDENPYATSVKIEWFEKVEGQNEGQQLYRKFIQSHSCRKI